MIIRAVIIRMDAKEDKEIGDFLSGIFDEGEKKEVCKLVECVPSLKIRKRSRMDDETRRVRNKAFAAESRQRKRARADEMERQHSIMCAELERLYDKFPDEYERRLEGVPVRFAPMNRVRKARPVSEEFGPPVLADLVCKSEPELRFE